MIMTHVPGLGLETLKENLKGVLVLLPDIDDEISCVIDIASCVRFERFTSRVRLTLLFEFSFHDSIAFHVLLCCIFGQFNEIDLVRAFDKGLDDQLVYPTRWIG